MSQVSSNGRVMVHDICKLFNFMQYEQYNQHLLKSINWPKWATCHRFAYSHWVHLILKYSICTISRVTCQTIAELFGCKSMLKWLKSESLMIGLAICHKFSFKLQINLQFTEFFKIKYERKGIKKINDHVFCHWILIESAFVKSSSPTKMHGWRRLAFMSVQCIIDSF